MLLFATAHHTELGLAMVGMCFLHTMNILAPWAFIKIKTKEEKLRSGGRIVLSVMLLIGFAIEVISVKLPLSLYG